MKKICILLVWMLLLSGCAAEQTFEHVEDVYGEQALPEPRQMQVTVPEDAAAQVIQGSSGKLYLCDGYEITMEVLSSGDLNKTVQSLTGFHQDGLTVLETGTSEIDRYECVWTAVGEGGDMVGRAAVIDDGDYHYCLTVTASSHKAGELSEQWKGLFESFSLQ